MENIAKAIIEVMKEVKGMEKNSKVGKGQNQYNGTKDQDVKEVFNDALSKHGLCILPTGIEENTDVHRYTDQYGKAKQSVFTKVTTKYILLHDSGEQMELAGYGHGVDTQDKGAGKATTYALKNCLLYSFLTPVGKIDDTDLTHSDDIPQSPSEFELALTQMENCNAIEEMKKCWADNKKWQNQILFEKAKNDKKEQLKETS